jgi:hypothetical protein
MPLCKIAEQRPLLASGFEPEEAPRTGEQKGVALRATSIFDRCSIQLSHSPARVSLTGVSLTRWSLLRVRHFFSPMNLLGYDVPGLRAQKAFARKIGKRENKRRTSLRVKCLAKCRVQLSNLLNPASAAERAAIISVET